MEARLFEYVDRVHGQHERVLITGMGRPVAALVSVDDLAGLEETLGILSDPEAVADLRQARKDAIAGRVPRGEPLEEFFEKGRRRVTAAGSRPA